MDRLQQSLQRYLAMSPANADIVRDACTTGAVKKAAKKLSSINALESSAVPQHIDDTLLVE